MRHFTEAGRKSRIQNRKQMRIPKAATKFSHHILRRAKKRNQIKTGRTDRSSSVGYVGYAIHFEVKLLGSADLPRQNY